MASQWPLISNILVFIINTVGIALIILVYFSNPKARVNRIFVSMVFLMFIWVNFAFLPRWTGPTKWSLSWIKIAWAITPLLFVLIYLFIISLLKIDKYKFLTALNFLIGIVFILITLFTNLIIKDIAYEDSTLRILYGKFVFVFFGAILYLTVLIFWILFRRYLKTFDKNERMKIKYILIGLSFFFLMNGVFNIFFPVFLKIVHLYEFGDYSTIVFFSFIAYAIAKRELFGIKIVFTAALVSLITLLLTLDVFIFTEPLLLKLYKALILVFFLYFGYLLVKSSIEELQYREKIKKAYEVEKKAHKELVRLDEAKTQFIMATQHHLRTPLTSMRGYLDLIFGGTYGKVPAKLKDPIFKFQVSTNRLIRIVNDFLDITQFQLGKKVISLQPNVSIKPIFKEIMEELQFEAKARNIYLKFQKPTLRQTQGKLPKIKADPEKLKMALFNLVDNGIKYTYKGGVTIKVKSQKSKVKTNEESLLIEVSDTGVGIPEEEVKNLFVRLFERSKEAKKIHGTGRGIGLFITSHIIKAHKGKIWAESEGRGKGSTFYVELPIGNR